MSAAITFQVASEATSSRFSQASCAAPRDAGLALVVALVPGGIAVAAHVDHEDVEQRAVGDLAIDAAVLGGHSAHRHEFVERAARPRHQKRAAVLGIAGLVGGADRRPVVGDLMIVPLREQGDGGMEGAKALVEPVVFVVAAELGEAVGDDGFFLGDDVSPDPAIGQLQFPLHRAIRIDVVTGMDEEVRTVVEHGAVSPHPATVFVDAPALPRGIARPGERYRCSLCRCGAEMPELRLAFDAALADVVEAYAIKNVLPGRQAVEQHLCGEITVRQCVGGQPSQ